MLFDLVEQAAKGMIHKVIPPKQRYFTYFFIIIGIIWLGSANYYYFADESSKFSGAIITGIIFFVLALGTTLWEYYMKKKLVKQSNINELVIKTLPMLLPFIFNKFKDSLIKKKTPKLLTLGLIISVIIYFFVNKNNKDID
jgi:hypothetical protein